MKQGEVSFQILHDQSINTVLEKIVECGRICYRSEGELDYETMNNFIMARIRDGHESILEHCSVSVIVICDRALSHEIVRHRIASYSQESQRYVNYKKYGITFIPPRSMTKDSMSMEVWEKAMKAAEDAYNELLRIGNKPEIARCVLPNCTRTKLVMTMNFREWRHFFKLRADKKAHPDMQHLATNMLRAFYKSWPAIFEDLIKQKEVVETEQPEAEEMREEREFGIIVEPVNDKTCLPEALGVCKESKYKQLLKPYSLKDGVLWRASLYDTAHDKDKQIYGVMENIFAIWKKWNKVYASLCDSLYPDGVTDDGIFDATRDHYRNLINLEKAKIEKFFWAEEHVLYLQKKE